MEKIPSEIKELISSLSKTTNVKISVNLSKAAISAIDKVAELFSKTRTDILESLILTMLPVYLDATEKSLIKAKDSEYYKKNKQVLDSVLEKISIIKGKLFV